MEWTEIDARRTLIVGPPGGGQGSVVHPEEVGAEAVVEPVGLVEAVSS